nr:MULTISPECIES: hypothetical protein [Pseudomonas syringae group genomosp. 2]
MPEKLLGSDTLSVTLLNYFQSLGQQYRPLSSGKKMLDLSAEQHQLAKTVHDYASRFPSTESGDSQLLQGCYDYMNAFKQVLDSSSKIQMDYICLQYPGFFRFAQMMCWR